MATLTAKPIARPHTFWDLHRRRIETYALRVGVLVVTALVWETLSALGLVHPFFASSPSRIGATFSTMLADGSLAENVGVTVYEAAVGFAVGATAGVLIGLALALWETFERTFDPYVVILNTLPRIALAPLFILWFGIGLTSKIVMAITVVIFMLIVNTHAGAKAVDQDQLVVGRLLGGRPRQILLTIILPSTVPWIFAGLRLALPYALTGAVVAEMIAAKAGIGYLISFHAGTYNTSGVFASLLALLIVSTIMYTVMKGVEDRLLRWRPDVLA